MPRPAPYKKADQDLLITAARGHADHACRNGVGRHSGPFAPGPPPGSASPPDWSKSESGICVGAVPTPPRAWNVDTSDQVRTPRPRMTSAPRERARGVRDGRVAGRKACTGLGGSGPDLVEGPRTGLMGSDDLGDRGAVRCRHLEAVEPRLARGLPFFEDSAHVVATSGAGDLGGAARGRGLRRDRFIDQHETTS